MAPTGAGAGGGGLEVSANLVDDYDLRHVVLHRLYHHLVLEGGRGYLHAPGAADPRVGDVAVAGDLVRGVHDNDAAVHLVRQVAGDLAQHRRFAHARAAQEKHALTVAHQVFDDADGAEHGAADAARNPDDAPLPVPDAGDAVERALYAGAVIGG